MRTRESPRGQARLVGLDKLKSEENLKTHGQSDWLIVLGDGESPLQGEAASR
jgi:hypothetical protein